MDDTLPRSAPSGVDSALALGDGARLALVAQPIGQIGESPVSYELLARVVRSDGLWCGPADILRRARYDGTAATLDGAVLRMAQERLVADPGLRLSVNVCPESLLDDGVWTTLASTPPGRLTIELAAGRVPSPSVLAQQAMRLEGMGVATALDDAVPGDGLLAILAEVESLACVKLDGRVIADAVRDARAAAILKGIVVACTALHVDVVAQHVETPEHLVVLRRAGITLAQGYIVGVPRPVTPRGAPSVDPTR